MQQLTKRSVLVFWSVTLMIGSSAHGMAATPTSKVKPSVTPPSATPPIVTPILRMDFGVGGRGSGGIRPVPLVVATPDGQLYQLVATVSTYPRRSLEAFSLLKLTKADFQSMIKLANAAKLTKKLDLGVPPTADVAPLIVTYKGTTNTIASFGVGDDAMPTKQLEGRKKIKALIAFIQSRPAAKVSVPSAIVVMPRNADGQMPTDPQLKQSPRPWPVAASDLREMGGCRVISGSEASAAYIALASTNELTPWTSSGYTYFVSARPFLPGDNGCSASAD